MPIRRQHRWTCAACTREWIFRTQDADTCPGCGSPEIVQIEFEGLFDSTTPADVLARAIDLPALEPPSEHREAEIVAPPFALLAEMPDPVAPSPIPEFA